MYKLGVLLILAIVLAGCFPATSSVTADCMTQPVLLGKIKRIHEIEQKEWNLRVPYSIERQGGVSADWGPRLIFEESVHPELFKLIESPHDKIAVQEIFIRSLNYWACLFVCGPGVQNSLIVTNGVIYREDSTGNDAKK